MLILCDNTTERVALLVGQLCDNTPEKAALLCHMLWSQRPYEVVISFTRSKPGPRAVRRIGLNLSGTTHPTLLPIGGLDIPYPTAARRGTAVILNRDPAAIDRIPIKRPLDRAPVISYPVKILAN